MTAVVTDKDGNGISTKNVLNLNGSSGDIINSASFVVEADQVVHYTVTATGTETPVISWLAVQKMSGNISSATRYCQHKPPCS